MLLSLVATIANAGTGPWILGDGDGQLYLGAETQRLERLAVQVAEGQEDVIDVDEGLSTVGLKGVVSYGITGRFEIEGTLPWYRVYANRDDGATCAALGPDSCATTAGIGVVSGRAKALALDEIAGAPVSLALGGEVRHGVFTSAERARITNLGEGTFDAGAFASVGRIMPLGTGYAANYLEVGARYRFPNTRSYPGAESGVPGMEYFGTAEALFSSSGAFAGGIEAGGVWRPDGLDWYELDLADPDRLAALRIGILRVGPKVVVRNKRGATFVASLLHTVVSFNNPIVTSVNVGVGLPAFRSESL